MLEFLYGYALGRQNAATASVAHDANHAAQRARSRADELQLQVDRLTLVTMALAELWAERGGPTEAQLLAKVQEIDLRDGHLDGKVTIKSAPSPCPACQRLLAAHHTHCIYCGTERPSGATKGYLGR